jgi:hypothetical protein
MFSEQAVSDEKVQQLLNLEGTLMAINARIHG